MEPCYGTSNNETMKACETHRLCEAEQATSRPGTHSRQGRQQSVNAARVRAHRVILTPVLVLRM